MKKTFEEIIEKSRAESEEQYPTYRTYAIVTTEPILSSEFKNIAKNLEKEMDDIEITYMHNYYLQMMSKQNFVYVISVSQGYANIGATISEIEKSVKIYTPKTYTPTFKVCYMGFGLDDDSIRTRRVL